MNFKKIKSVFLDIISFGTPQAKVFNLSSVLVIFSVVPTGSLNYLPIRCVFKHFLLPLIFNGNCPADGVFAQCNCPACGMTRAMSRLLHGDISGAYNFNKLIFIVFFVIVSLIVINLVKSVKYYKKNRMVYGF
ncbi:DUF2752 domain-containing protein [Candidatus Woesearchaeota archaeon]|nr:DUF2752 domain-containing protein [Candidatus Woesearchaeota archaeon]